MKRTVSIFLSFIILISCILVSDSFAVFSASQGLITNGDFSQDTTGWSCDYGSLTIKDEPDGYAINGKTLCIPYGANATQTISVEKNTIYSFYCDMRTTGNHMVYFRVYSGSAVSASALIAEDYVTTLTWNTSLTSSRGEFYSGDFDKVTICIYNNCSNIITVDNVSVEKMENTIYSSVYNGDFEEGTAGWNANNGTLSIRTDSYSISGNTLSMPHGVTATQIVKVEKNSVYSYSFDVRTTSNHMFYFRIYGGVGTSEKNLLDETYITDITWNQSVVSTTKEFLTEDYDLITICMYNKCNNIATVDNVRIENRGADNAPKAYLFDFKNNNTTTNAYPVEYFCANGNSNGKQVSFSFDYYMPEQIESAIVQDCNHGMKYPDNNNGSYNLKKGQHTYTYSNDSFASASGIFAPGIQMGSVDYGSVYIWNISVKINGSEVPLNFGGSLNVKKIELSKVPFEQFYCITSNEKAFVIPDIQPLVLSNTDSASVSFEYYLSSGKASVGSDLLEAGVNSYSATISGQDINGNYLPIIALEGESLLYVWDFKLKKNTTNEDVALLVSDKGNVERIKFNDIPLPKEPQILSAEDNVVTLTPIEGYEYSADGKIWQASNVFEGLKNDEVYTFLQRKISDKATLGYVKLAFPSVPQIELQGETKLIVKQVEGYEYSVDLKEWYKTNEFTLLDADKEYKVYQRLALADDVYEIVSTAKSAVTNGNDVLEGTQAEKLSFVRKQLVKKGNDLSADTNEDGELDIRDLVTLKKNTITEPTRIIPCFGDSITEGMGMAAGKSYPSQLNDMLGKEFTVLNGGASGENSFTIAARQGAFELFTLNDIIFPVNQNKITIGNASSNGIGSADGRPLSVTKILSTPMSVNPIKIMDQNFTASLENFSWNTATTPIKYDFTIMRSGNTSSPLVIPKGTKVTLPSADIAVNSYCDIYYIGANGGYDGNTQTLIEQYKAMIKHHANRRYLIIIPHWTNKFDEVFKKEFGNHAVNFRKAAIEYGLEYEGLTATDTDNALMRGGSVPASLCYQNKYDIHLNEHGYHFLAHLLYERGKELKFW